MLQWWRESLRYKPWRPVTASLITLVGRLIGGVGRAMTIGWHVLTRQPAPPAAHALTAQRILCLRPDRIGDVVLVTPALAALRERFPQAHIAVLVAHATRTLVTGHPAINQVVCVRGDRWRDLWYDRHTLEQVRRDRFDVVVVFESSWCCTVLAWWLGVRYRVGYDTHGQGFLLTHALPDPSRRIKTHQVVVNARLVEALGCRTVTATGPLRVAMTAEARAAAQRWLQQHGLRADQPLVIVHPGSRSRYTQWAPHHFGAVADRIAATCGGHVVILCGPGEEPIVRRMMAAMHTRPPVASDLALDVVVALLSQVQLFLGNATGTMHLASAVGPRVIAIIGGTHPHDCPERWGPWGTGHVVVHKTPEATIGHATWQWVGPEGLRWITPDDVMAVVRPQLAGDAHPTPSAPGPRL